MKTGPNRLIPQKLAANLVLYCHTISISLYVKPLLPQTWSIGDVLECSVVFKQWNKCNFLLYPS